MVLVWRITDNSPNLPNFPPAKLSRYTVTVRRIHNTCLYALSVGIVNFVLISQSLVVMDERENVAKNKDV